MHTGNAMPTYNFKHKVTGEDSEVFLKMSELTEFKASNPDLTQVISGEQFVVL